MQLALDLEKQARESWLKIAWAAVLEHFKTNATISADEVREICPAPSSLDPRIYGVLLRRKELQFIGYKKSARKQCHHRAIAIFSLRRSCNAENTAQL